MSVVDNDLTDDTVLHAGNAMQRTKAVDQYQQINTDDSELMFRECLLQYFSHLPRSIIRLLMGGVKELHSI